jgi:hypothetical protein
MRVAVGMTICLICSPLAAPAPRTADGKPDLSGIWGLACPVADNTNGTVTGANVFCATEVSVPPEFFNFGQSIKDGLPYQPWAAEVVRKTRAAGRPDDPLSRCFPPGMVRLEVFPLFRKMIQIPGLLVILNEHNASYRQIFTDGLWLDTGGSPLTDAAKVTEKFRRLNYGTLEIELTVDDSKAYTKPWSIKVKQILAPDTELLDYICLENERDVRHLPSQVK